MESPDNIDSTAGSGLVSTDLFSPYFSDSSVTIYHGDSRHIVPTLGGFDLLLTDPPYGIGDKWTTGEIVAKTGSSRLWGKGETWDDQPAPWWLMLAMMERCEKSIVWGGNYYPMPPSRCWLSWDKVQEFTGSDSEHAWTNMDKAARTFRMSRGAAHAQMKKVHPTEKPLKLIQWCIEQAGDVATILDPFAGSGTTGEAAKVLGKRAVLIEREEKYCEAAAKRLSQEMLIF
jgi:hypothetical protein